MESPLAKLYQACDPMEAATTEQYVDCSDVRGSHAFSGRFCNALRNAGTGSSFLRFLITGHVGGGKSSELAHLQAKLESMDKPFLVVMMDAKDYIDDNDVTPNDILLAIISELAATVKSKTGVELSDSYLTRKLNELILFLGREVDVESVDVPLWEAKAKIKLLKQNETARQQVRDKLLPIESSFLQEINVVFEQARLEIRKKGYEDIVLILDNLEKIQRLEGADEGSESHRELFIHRSQKFVGLKCSFVLTVPLTLVRTNSGALRNAYGETPFTLPMVKVATRDGETYEAGYVMLREVLRNRGVNDTIIEPDAQELLIQYSGGHVRDLLGSIRSAISLATQDKVTLKEARAALGQIVTSLNPTKPEWEVLAALECDPNRKLDSGDPVSARILEQLFALEYINGGDNEDFIQHEEPWYAIQPLLKGTRSFKSALEAYKASK